MTDNPHGGPAQGAAAAGDSAQFGPGASLRGIHQGMRMAENPRLSELVSIGFESTGLALFDILQVAQAQTSFPVVVIAKIEDDSFQVEAVADLTRSGLRPGTSFELSTRFDADVAALRSPVSVPDAAADEHFSDRARRSNIGAYLGVPITFGDGSLFGTLSASDSSPRPIGREEVQLFKTLARAAAREMERSNNLESLTLPGSKVAEKLTGLGIATGEAWAELPEDRKKELAEAVDSLAATFAGAVTTTHIDEEPLEEVEPSNETDWPANLDLLVRRAPSLLPNLPGPRVKVTTETDALIDLEGRVLERILANLMLNAWRSAPPNTKMTVTGTRHGEWVELAVEDQSGLHAEESKPRRLHPAGGGRIGIPIVKSLVEEVGGSVRQEATDEGRRYVVKLPVLRGVNDPEPIASVTQLRREDR